MFFVIVIANWKLSSVLQLRGAGTPEHFAEVLTEGGADAALAASLFHDKILSVRQVKDYLAWRGIAVRRSEDIFYTLGTVLTTTSLHCKVLLNTVKC